MQILIKDAEYISEPNGKSHFIFDCPFCGEQIVLYVWNGHKKCSCGARCSRYLNGRYQLNARKE